MALPIWAYYMKKVFADRSLGYDPNEKFDIPEDFNPCSSADDEIDSRYSIEAPTYHVFNMYKDFQEATYLPMDVKTDSMDVRDNRRIPLLSSSAARKADGTIVVSLANVSLDKEQKVELSLEGIAAKPKSVSGQILSCKAITDYNDFEHPDRVVPAEFKGAKLSKQTVTVKVPAKSIAVIRIK